MTEVVADNVQFLEPRSARSDGDNNMPSKQREPVTVQSGNQNKEMEPIDISDDDLPF